MCNNVGFFFWERQEMLKRERGDDMLQRSAGWNHTLTTGSGLVHGVRALAGEQTGVPVFFCFNEWRYKIYVPFNILIIIFIEF